MISLSNNGFKIPTRNGRRTKQGDKKINELEWGINSIVLKSNFYILFGILKEAADHTSHTIIWCQDGLKPHQHLLNK
jgi:hypothetical protein